MHDPTPTRSELIATRRRIKLAQSGHALLKKKRDGLMREFFILARKSRIQEEQLCAQAKAAQLSMNRARLVESDLRIESLAWAVRDRPSVVVETHNVIGVSVPLVSGAKVSKRLTERGYEIFNSVLIDEAAGAYEKLIDSIVGVAKTQVALRRIVAEIERTKRRVNALEFNLIPRLDTQRRRISSRLEEMDRENFMRLKLIKRTLESQAIAQTHAKALAAQERIDAPPAAGA